MPALRNARHEAVAQGIVEGKTKTQAYRDAGFNGTNPGSVHAVTNRPDVEERVHELTAARHQRAIRSDERAIEKASISKEWIVQRAKYVVDRAVRGTKPIYDATGQPIGWLPSASDNGAAIDGLALLARMGGFLIERHEVGAPGDFSRMTDEELNAELIEVGQSIGLTDQALKAIGNR